MEGRMSTAKLLAMGDKRVGADNDLLLERARHVMNSSPQPRYEIHMWDTLLAMKEKARLGINFNRSVTMSLSSRWEVVNKLTVAFLREVISLNDQLTEEATKQARQLLSLILTRTKRIAMGSRIEQMGGLLMHITFYRTVLKAKLSELVDSANFLIQCAELMGFNSPSQIMDRYSALRYILREIAEDHEKQAAQLCVLQDFHQEMIQRGVEEHMLQYNIMAELNERRKEVRKEISEMEIFVEEKENQAAEAEVAMKKIKESIYHCYSTIMTYRGLECRETDPVLQMHDLGVRLNISLAAVKMVEEQLLKPTVAFATGSETANYRRGSRRHSRVSRSIAVETFSEDDDNASVASGARESNKSANRRTTAPTTASTTAPTTTTNTRSDVNNGHSHHTQVSTTAPAPCQAEGGEDGPLRGEPGLRRKGCTRAPAPLLSIAARGGVGGNTVKLPLMNRSLTLGNRPAPRFSACASMPPGSSHDLPNIPVGERRRAGAAEAARGERRGGVVLGRRSEKSGSLFSGAMSEGLSNKSRYGRSLTTAEGAEILSGRLASHADVMRQASPQRKTVDSACNELCQRPHSLRRRTPRLVSPLFDSVNEELHGKLAGHKDSRRSALHSTTVSPSRGSIVRSPEGRPGSALMESVVDRPGASVSSVTCLTRMSERARSKMADVNRLYYLAESSPTVTCGLWDDGVYLGPQVSSPTSRSKARGRRAPGTVRTLSVAEGKLVSSNVPTSPPVRGLRQRCFSVPRGVGLEDAGFHRSTGTGAVRFPSPKDSLTEDKDAPTRHQSPRAPVEADMYVPPPVRQAAKTLPRRSSSSIRISPSPPGRQSRRRLSHRSPTAAVGVGSERRDTRAARSHAPCTYVPRAVGSKVRGRQCLTRGRLLTSRRATVASRECPVAEVGRLVSRLCETRDFRHNCLSILASVRLRSRWPEAERLRDLPDPAVTQASGQ